MWHNTSTIPVVEVHHSAVAANLLLPMDGSVNALDAIARSPCGRSNTMSVLRASRNAGVITHFPDLSFEQRIARFENLVVDVMQVGLWLLLMIDAVRQLTDLLLRYTALQFAQHFGEVFHDVLVLSAACTALRCFSP